MINNKYIIKSIINSGNFGCVYKCIFNKSLYALKEDKNSNILKHETNIYKKLLNINNISKIYDFFLFNNKYYLVLDYFEMDLTKYKLQFYNTNDYKIKLYNTFIVLIDTLNKIHDNNIIHRDLKPSNICFNKNLEPYIIDFGLSKEFIVNNKHILEKNINNIIGSINFASLNIINLIEPSRRDDLESIIYIYLYMILSNKNYLKYDNLNIEHKKDIIYIKSIFENIDINILNNIFNSTIYVRRLHFNQMPNYHLFKRKLLH